MTLLGEPLVFYLKYMAEMTILYGDAVYDGGDEPYLKELDNAEQVRAAAHTVGATADEQAADFLELCGKAIEEHLTGLGFTNFANRARRATLAHNWDWHIRVHVRSSLQAGWFYCGVSMVSPPDVRISVEKEVCGIVLPYLWMDYQSGAGAVWSTLRGWPQAHAGLGLVEDSRTVVLNCIPIKPDPPGSFSVEREPLIAAVKKTFAQIGPKHAKAIASAAARLKKAEVS
jgi:hypothetical protein